jgi:hypothetical protein
MFRPQPAARPKSGPQVGKAENTDLESGNLHAPNPALLCIYRSSDPVNRMNSVHPLTRRKKANARHALFPKI